MYKLNWAWWWWWCGVGGGGWGGRGRYYGVGVAGHASVIIRLVCTVNCASL